MIYEGAQCHFPVPTEDPWGLYSSLLDILRTAVSTFDNAQLFEEWYRRQELDRPQMLPKEKRAFQQLMLKLAENAPNSEEESLVCKDGRWFLSTKATPSIRVTTRLDEHEFKNLLLQTEKAQLVFTSQYNEGTPHEPSFRIWGCCISYGLLRSADLAGVVWCKSEPHSSVQACRDGLTLMLLREFAKTHPGDEILDRAPMSVLTPQDGCQTLSFTSKAQILEHNERIVAETTLRTGDYYLERARIGYKLSLKQKTVLAVITPFVGIKTLAYLLTKAKSSVCSFASDLILDINTIAQSLELLVRPCRDYVRTHCIEHVLRFLQGVYLNAGSPCRDQVLRLRFAISSTVVSCFKKLSELRSPGRLLTVALLSTVCYQCYKKKLQAEVISTVDVVEDSLECKGVVSEVREFTPFMGKSQTLCETILPSNPVIIKAPSSPPNFICAVFGRTGKKVYGNGVASCIIDMDKKMILSLTGHQIEMAGNYEEIGFAPITGMNRETWDWDPGCFHWEKFLESRAYFEREWVINFFHAQTGRQHDILIDGPFLGTDKFPRSHFGRDTATYKPTAFPKGLRSMPMTQITDSSCGAVQIFGVIKDNETDKFVVVSSMPGAIVPDTMITTHLSLHGEDGENITMDVDFSAEMHYGVCGARYSSMSGCSGSPVLSHSGGRYWSHGTHAFGTLGDNDMNYFVTAHEILHTLRQAEMSDSFVPFLAKALADKQFFIGPMVQHQLHPCETPVLKSGRRQGKSAWRERKATQKAYDALDPEERKNKAESELAHEQEILRLQSDKRQPGHQLDKRSIDKLQRNVTRLTALASKARLDIARRQNNPTYRPVRAVTGPAGRNAMVMVNPAWADADNDDDDIGINLGWGARRGGIFDSNQGDDGIYVPECKAPTVHLSVTKKIKLIDTKEQEGLRKMQELAEQYPDLAKFLVSASTETLTPSKALGTVLGSVGGAVSEADLACETQPVQYVEAYASQDFCTA